MLLCGRSRTRQQPAPRCPSEQEEQRGDDGRKARYYKDDLVVCVLRDGFSRVEQTLLEGGRGSAVIQQRMQFQELMRDRFESVIERATGRRVIGFMSGNQQQPDMMCEVFILGPTDLVDQHEIPVSGPPPGLTTS